jgi:hypothetical protein
MSGITGRIVAEMVLRGTAKASVPLEQFSPARFIN